jgi:crotonobetainyl-CoA:carnitine CoA-transferase CaiB-like acyl-CoA transferase
VSEGALSGLKVLDLSRLLPGPFCSLLFADCGADVIKVEDTGMGDYVRWAPPAYPGVEQSSAGALFLSLNRNKRSIRIDLKSEEGKEVLRRLVKDADVLLESFRPGVLDRLGVGYEELKKINPGLVYCAISGYGQDGPGRDAAGHDMNYLALGGLLGLTGEADGAPVQAAGQIADIGGGALMAAFGILAALRARDRDGQGQFVDVSMFDGALSWLAMPAAQGMLEGDSPKRGNVGLAGSLICYRPYACSDGHVALGALEAKFWKAFCEGVQRPDLIEQQFSPVGGEVHLEVEGIFRSRTRDEWEQFAAVHDCCLTPILTLDEALESEMAKARAMIAPLTQPGSEKQVRLLGAPVKFSRTPADTDRLPGPGLGEHTDELLSGAGYSGAEIAALREAGAVSGPPESATGSFMG